MMPLPRYFVADRFDRGIARGYEDRICEFGDVFGFVDYGGIGEVLG